MPDYKAIIKAKYRENEFNINDLSRLFNVKKRKAYSILSGLDHVVKLAKGMYKLANKRAITMDKSIEKIKMHLMHKISRKFSFTGLSILEPFMHHISYVMIYHLYVEPGSSEDFKEEIKDMHTLINPKKEDILLLLNNTKINKLVIIRENNYFLYSKEGIASVEKAFIDLYFEVTREKIPFIKTDLEEIFKSLAINNMINYSVLLRYAHIRGIKKELKAFIGKLSSIANIPKKVLE